MSKLLSRAKVREMLLGLGLVLSTLALLLWPQQAMAAVREGLGLCGNVIIPSLFPFFILSALVVDLGLAARLGRALEGLMWPLFRVPGACASALVLGFVGGYPVGARTALQLYREGLCSKVQCQRLLAFCNNSGPAFILGVVGAGVFTNSRVGVLLCLAHAAASVCVGLVFRFYGGRESRRDRRPAPQFAAKRFTAAFTGAVTGAAGSALHICAFVVLFTVIIRLLFLSGLLPALARLLGVVLGPLGLTQPWAERLLTGALELSSGVWSLAGKGDLAGRLSMAAFMLGWAGLSVHCQVLSFLGDSGLSPNTYLAGKLLHGGLSALFVGALGRLVPLHEPVGAYLAEQVEGIAGLDFSSALTISTVCAWVLWLGFFALAVLAARKTSGKCRGFVVQ